MFSEIFRAITLGDICHGRYCEHNSEDKTTSEDKKLNLFNLFLFTMLPFDPSKNRKPLVF